MIFKLVTLFLVFIACLAMLGKMHWIGGKRLANAKCNYVGGFVLAKVPVAVGKTKPSFRSVWEERFDDQ